MHCYILYALNYGRDERHEVEDDSEIAQATLYGYSKMNGVTVFLQTLLHVVP